MRHLNIGRKFNRTSSHRQAMFRNMCASLIQHEIIKTTVPKAKELRRFIEPLIALARVDSVANRRLAVSRLGNKKAVRILFEDLGPRYATRPGGYTRVLKCGFRSGDAAPMAYIEFVDRPLVFNAPEVEDTEATVVDHRDGEQQEAAADHVHGPHCNHDHHQDHVEVEHVHGPNCNHDHGHHDAHVHQEHHVHGPNCNHDHDDHIADAEIVEHSSEKKH